MSEMNTAITSDTVPETEQAPKVRKPRSDKGQSRKRIDSGVSFTLDGAPVSITSYTEAKEIDYSDDAAVVVLMQQAQSLRTQLDKTERALAVLRG